MSTKEERIERMMAASAEPGATAQPAPEVSDAAEPEVETAETAAPDAAGQQAPPDPTAAWKSAFGSPEEAQKAKQELENLRAMQRESHERNRDARLRDESAGQKLSRMEELERKVEQGLESSRVLADTLITIGRTNPEMAQQLWTMFPEAAEAAGARQRQVAAAPQRQSAPAGDPHYEALAQQVKTLAFGLSHRDVVSAVVNSTGRIPLLQRVDMVEAGVPDRVMQAAITALYEQDKAEPGSVNPMDPVRFNAVVDAAVKKENAFFEKLYNNNVNHYRAVKKAKALEAPPSSKGPSASVRAGPALPKATGKVGSPAWTAARVQRFTQVSNQRNGARET